MQKPAYSRLIIVLICGIFAVSTASILIRLALDEGVPALVVAAYRLTFATLILTPIVLRARTAELRGLTRRDWLWALVSGVFLALHFATWISSLDYTTVTSSVVLVTTGPIWVALASWLIFREKLTAPDRDRLDRRGVRRHARRLVRQRADWGSAGRSCGAIFWRWPGRGLWRAICSSGGSCAIGCHC